MSVGQRVFVHADSASGFGNLVFGHKRNRPSDRENVRCVRLLQAEVQKAFSLSTADGDFAESSVVAEVVVEDDPMADAELARDHNQHKRRKLSRTEYRHLQRKRHALEEQADVRKVFSLRFPQKVPWWRKLLPVEDDVAAVNVTCDFRECKEKTRLELYTGSQVQRLQMH